jgi:hypothetical protein
LTEADLMCIFQGALPAGVYHEVMYFLPIALQHIAENQENDTLDNLLRWISYNQNALQADNCYDDLLNFFELLFVQWISSFDLNGDYPKNCAVVSTLIEELNVPAFNLYGDILLQKHLGNAATYETAAWLIYLLENHLWGWEKRSQYLSMLAADKNLLKKAKPYKENNKRLNKIPLCGSIIYNFLQKSTGIIDFFTLLHYNK